jgi:hypothetical protein
MEKTSTKGRIKQKLMKVNILRKIKFGQFYMTFKR